VSATAIILARAGSRGVPGKNTAPIAGRPCIAWTIDHAQSSRTVSRVVVSSDDPVALSVAASMGAQTITRPLSLAHDTARIDDAARHALSELGEPGGPVVILYANVPVRPTDLTDRAMDLLVSSGCHSVQSYAPVGKYHPWWIARLDNAGQVRPWEGDVLNHAVFRRQDLPPAFIPDGGVIACTPDALMLRIGAPDGPHAFFGTDRRGVTNEEGAVIDIDGPADLIAAEIALTAWTAASEKTR
jgi:CMP-N,N'-diacetyllegionaminic acid synthase